jgi:ribonuclease Y
MTPALISIFPALAGLLFGVALGAIFLKLAPGGGRRISKTLQQKIDTQKQTLAEIERKTIEARSWTQAAEAEAKAKATEILSEAKLHAQQARTELEKQAARIEEHERTMKEHEVELKTEHQKLTEAKREIESLRNELSQAAEKHRSALEEVARLTEEEAKRQLQEELQREFSPYFARQVELLKKNAEAAVDEHAKNLLSEAIQRYASEVSGESTATVVQLPSDDLKGRIIGKEGRNIIAFEQATGVDVIIDDTPGAIVISGYDLVRRYVAKRTMEKLLKDGRIQPARIEEVVEKTKQEVGKMMVQFGERALEEFGVTGYHHDLVKLIGRLRFRTSYGQNVLKHSIEMAHLGRMIAEEIGADGKVVAEGCLLHDIGKTLDHEVMGTHVEIGVQICRKYKVRPEVIHCIEAHHDDVPIQSAEAFIVAAADAISGARPGARRESLEAYIKRLTDLEEVARSFEGVQKAYVISAGREVRVFVDTQKIDDLRQLSLAKDIAEKIEKELTYPGVIKVNVIRERRVEELAK